MHALEVINLEVTNRKSAKQDATLVTREKMSFI